MAERRKVVSVRDELRDKFPGRASKADYGRSAISALRLNCAECMGGNVSLVRTCDCYDCFLWPYRAN